MEQRKITDWDELTGLLRRRLEETPRLILAIDGRCASGKTTLAGTLQKRFGWSVIHMDHFFLRPEQRTPERYAQPGENVDHERFLEEVLLPLERGELKEYRPFDCQTFTLAEPLLVPESPVTVVEGSYSCHRDLWDHYDLHIFLTVDQVKQMERILAREGERKAEAFREKWIPLEERYIAASGVDKRCDILLEL